MTFDPLAHTRSYANAGGEFVKFPTLGSWVAFTVTNARPFNNDGETVTALDGTDDTGKAVTMPLDTGPKATAFLEAVSNAGMTQLVYPFRITMQWHDEKDTGKGNPLKLYRASIERMAAGPAVADMPMPGGGASAPAPMPAPPAPFPTAPQAPAAAPASQGPPPGFPPGPGEVGGPPAYAAQPPAAPGGPPPSLPYAQVDGQWVAPGDPRYPAQAPQSAPAPPAPPTAGTEPANPLGALFQ